MCIILKYRLKIDWRTLDAAECLAISFVVQVYVEYAGSEDPSAEHFINSRFYTLLDRHQNTIRIHVSLPSISKSTAVLHVSVVKRSGAQNRVKRDTYVRCLLFHFAQVFMVVSVCNYGFFHLLKRRHRFGSNRTKIQINVQQYKINMYDWNWYTIFIYNTKLIVIAC